MPGSFLDHPGPIPFAHRGGAGDWPENTFPAFESAVELGYRYLETDVHATRDGRVVAFHDDRLDRVTDRVGVIRDMNWSEVSKALVHDREPIPLLEDLLDAWPDARLNIDPKDDGVVDALVRVVQRTGSVNRICIGSFSDRRIVRIQKALGSRLCVSLGPRGVARLRIGSFGVPTGSFTAKCVQVPPTVRGRALVDERFVERAHRVGLAVHVWTIDDPGEMYRLLDMGVDGIMTDRPEVLRRVLIERDQWF